MKIAFFRQAEGVGLTLSEADRAQVELMARFVPFRPSIIYSSPYDKAVETARVIARVKKASYTTIPELSPAIASFEALSNYVKENSIFVGHSPSIEAIIAALIGGGNIRLDPGGFALIEARRYAHGDGMLVLLMNPQFAMIL